MRVICVDVKSPRSDGQRGRPTGITVGVIYDVAEVTDSQFSIINDNMMMKRYNQSRFEVIDESPVLPLRENFNTLTTCMRSKIKALEKELNKLKYVEV